MKTVSENKIKQRDDEELKTPFDVLYYTDPDLRRTCRKVRHMNEEMRKAIGDMTTTMLTREGIGLAAPQVGIYKRFFLFTANPEYFRDDESIRVRVAINPQVIERDGEIISYEGCLSYPDHVAKVNRALKIKVRFQDIDMNKVEEELTGLAARVFQHELDHLDGILFVDRMEPDTLKHVDELEGENETDVSPEKEIPPGG
jgi:peptide deformylase